MMQNSFNIWGKYVEENQSLLDLEKSKIELDKWVSEIDHKTTEHISEMNDLNLVEKTEKEIQMEALMRQLNGEPEGVKEVTIDVLLAWYNNIKPKVVETSYVNGVNNYKPQQILSSMLDIVKKDGYSDVEITNVTVDENGNILSIWSKWKNQKWESVGPNFYRNCKCSAFYSDQNCIINEYYEGDNVVWAETPIKIDE